MLSDLSLSLTPSLLKAKRKRGSCKVGGREEGREGGQAKRLRVIFQSVGGAGPLPIVALCCALVVAGIEGVKNRRRRE